MSDWKAKRFWKNTTVSEADGGFEILLDGRSVKTPAKSALIVPTEAMAQKIASEWEAQVDEIDPTTMPVTRTANSAIDKVAVQHDEVAGMIAAYGETDLLCYRASEPVELIARQTEAWDPVLDWATKTYDAPLNIGQGVMHVAQPEPSISKLASAVFEMDPFRLAGFHDLVCLSGSLVLSLAVTKRRLSGGEAWQLSRIDELWQIEQWGEDDEATAFAAKKESDFLNAENFYELSVT